MTGYKIRSHEMLGKLLWLDFALGFSTALIGIMFYKSLDPLLGIHRVTILVISVITITYAVFAGTLAIRKNIAVSSVRMLVMGNWIWALISTALLFFYLSAATPWGLAFLILQVVVVGGLAYWEGIQLEKVN